MRRAALIPASGVLLVGPTVLAFFGGGFFDGPLATAAAAAWALVLVLAITGPLPLPATRPGWVAVGGLAGLAAWSAVSIAWAPLDGPASDNCQRLLLYLGTLLAAIALLRDRRAARAVEPMLALGSVVVIGYGLSGRLLPGLVELSASFGAAGRLEQPITYWNAEGLLAAIGIILCARIAGDRSRAAAMRVVAAASCAPLGAGVYLSYSRGAIAAAVAGFVVLLAAAPTWPQLRAMVTALAAGVVASVCSAALPGVASLRGSAAEQQHDGAVMLALLAAIVLVAGFVTARVARSEARGHARLGPLRHARRLAALAAAAGGLCACGLIVGGLGERGDASPKASANPARLTSVTSRRYEYWRVGLRAFERHPARGVGAAGFRVVWLMERPVTGGALEVHSLVLEMATELGVPGLLLFALFLGGVATATRRALRSGAPLAAGACAACSVWLLHATIDWDWQLPAVTLPAIVLAGALLAGSESSRPSSPAPRVALAALAALAIVLIAWFAVLARNARIGGEAATRITSELSDAGWARSLDDFRRAELLDPGTEWRAISANYLLLRDNREALRVAQSVVRDEPDNLDGWSVVYRATLGRDPRRSSRALAEIRRLNPVASDE